MLHVLTYHYLNVKITLRLKKFYGVFTSRALVEHKNVCSLVQRTKSIQLGWEKELLCFFLVEGQLPLEAYAFCFRKKCKVIWQSIDWGWS